MEVVSSPQTSIQQINATDFEFDEIELFNQGSAYTYRGPSDDLQRLVFRVFVSTEIISSPSPCGSNCSYDFEFFGPAFQCTVVDVLPEIINATFYNTSMGGADEPSLTNYISFTEDYQNETGIWIAYAPPDGNIGVGNLETFFCAMFNATYNTVITYMNNLPNYNTSFTYHGQLANWTSYADDLQVLGLSYDLATSRQNFMSITQQIETMLAGITYQTTFADNTEGTQIALFGVNDLTGVHPVYPTNLPEQIEDLMTNVTLSLRLRNQSTQPSDDQQTFIITASITAYPARYNYAVAVLWEAYGTAIACTAVCILVGSCMLFINGVDADRSFSQILVTTRHESLDRVCAGQDRGGEFRSDELRRLPLKYGRIQTIEGPRFAFATSDEVEAFRK